MLSAPARELGLDQNAALSSHSDDQITVLADVPRGRGLSIRLYVVQRNVSGRPLRGGIRDDL